MKKLIPLFLLISGLNLLAQENSWDVIWKMEKLPFLDTNAIYISELAIVKGGFDTDQDGWGEFLCAWTDMEENYTLMYEATGDNQYELVWYFLHPLPTNTYAGIAVGDVDNNGIVDIVVTLPSQITNEDNNPPRLWVFEWNGVVGENKYGSYAGNEMSPTNTWNFDLPVDTDFRPYSLTIEDIDDDGDNELIVGVRQGDRGREVIVASVNGELNVFGFWEIEYNFAQVFGGALYSVTTGDLDDDGLKEIYAFIWNNFTLRIFEYDGSGGYNIPVALDEIYRDENIDFGALDAVRVADVNNDGVNELYIAGTEPDNYLFIITDISDLTLITEADVNVLLKIPRINVGKLRSMYVADPDHDGNLSLMIGGEGNGQIFDVEYKGFGDPKDSASWDVNVIFDLWEYSGYASTDNQTLTPRFFYGYPTGDMDGDGKFEYAFVNYANDQSVWSEDPFMFIIEIDKVVGVEDEANLTPQNFMLNQNYPNPFNPSTKISYALRESGFVNLKVYDVLGNEVATLVNTTKQAGNHSVEFNAVDLPSGVYFYTLQVNGFSDSKKMLLLK
ncbi:MAG: T9SS type A sorting domain-containing protein [Ignavibacteriaceae bacterium]|nr:T9SS type A sorting domain-containing protein [Ignavibacteriaceae bacterium]